LRRPLLIALSVLVALLAPAAARAAQLSTLTVPEDGGCPRVGPDIATPRLAISGIGFGANETVDIQVNGSAVSSAATDAAGNFPSTPFNPDIGNHNKATITVTAHGETSSIDAALPPFPVVVPNVAIPNGRPQSRVLYRLYGFPNGKTVYAHYTLHGHQRAVAKLGTAKGPCGTLSKRERILPAKFRKGTWVYHFNNSKTSRNAQPYYEINEQLTLGL
jgi:hypothetical protein